MTTGLLRADAVVIGGGLAGLWAVLHCPGEWEILVVDKGKGPERGSSPWAQGGMAVAVGPHDSPELHANDTIRAGAGLCDLAAVNVLVEEARSALDELIALGCAFDLLEDGSLDLNREGGQSLPRSVHSADATGREIMRAVVEQARMRAQRLQGTARSLLVSDGQCAGVKVSTPQGEVDVVAPVTLLATGGCGALYEATTNPDAATGDGLALAFQAGAEVRDCEFVQFHPTALAQPGLRRVLLTEALRGEGAIVVDGSGKRFLLDTHPDGELGPRDVVARAIASQGDAFLDARPIGSEAVRSRFPNIVAAAAEAGHDLASEPVPIAPAAHYFLGGVTTDTWGRTTMPGLYAAGECAATGVHGANRMAGNSLTEAVVFGRRVALAMAADNPQAPSTPKHDGAPAPDIRLLGSGGWDELRAALSKGVGLERSKSSLEGAEATLAGLEASATGDLALAVAAAQLICRSAIERQESRGAHFRSDIPQADESWSARRVAWRLGSS